MRPPSGKVPSAARLVRGDACLACRIRKVVRLRHLRLNPIFGISLSESKKRSDLFSLILEQKCNGARPKCWRCELLDKDCSYVGYIPQPGRTTDSLQSRALELELQIVDLTNCHNRILLSHRVFEQFRLLEISIVPRSKFVLALAIPVLSLYPWDLPPPPPADDQPSDVRVYFDPQRVPRLSLSSAILESLFADWRPELGISMQQSLYLYVGISFI